MGIFINLVSLMQFFYKDFCYSMGEGDAAKCYGYVTKG